MNLYEAIFYRKSIRKYKPVPLAGETLTNIKSMILNVDRLYEDIKMGIHIVEDGILIQEISKGIIGSYGKILAPHYLVITSEEKEGYQENVGYTLEQVVLNLTTMGIGTCWIGGLIKKELLDGVVDIPSNQKPIIVIAFGIPMADDLNVIISNEDRRKAVSSIVLNEYDKSLEPLIQAIRRAPSAMNSQSWRLFIGDKGIDIYLEEGNFITKKKYYFNRLDGGIALAHLKAACDEFKIDVSFEKKQKVEKELEYLITAAIKK